MVTKTVPFDAADYIDTPEAQVDLLQDAFETGDSTYIAIALGTIARARGMTSVARDAGVTREALYKALGPNGDPKLSTLLGVLKALGFELSASPSPATWKRHDPAVTFRPRFRADVSPPASSGSQRT